jgi:cell volume regulation protein A
MTVPILFALIGCVILGGFLANLLFRLTRIPGVILLIAIGVVLGPVTGWIRSDALVTIAPFFGATALLVILFEGGLELDVLHVVRHASRAAMLAGVVFALSFVSVAAAARVLAGFSWLPALMLGAILAATSPAICLPVVSGLSLRADVKTLVKLEAVVGEVLLIVTVVLLIENHQAPAGPLAWTWGFARSLLVALLVSSVAGVLWSRLVGWMGREPLAYMLTLGMVCLLYFAVEELGGSPAIAILLFGLILANMQSIAARIGPRARELFGVDIREEQFVLNQFMVSITAELSFLVRTFFFVYLGLILDLSALSPAVAAAGVAMFGLLLASRRVGLAALTRGGSRFSRGELQAIMALQPRGLATAVVALLPVQAGVEGTNLFPVFAFLLIILSNVFMTGGIVLADRRLRRESAEGPSLAEAEVPAGLDEPPQPAGPATDAPVPPVPVARRPPPFSPAADFAGEPPPSNFPDLMARVFGLRLADREAEYGEMIRASYFNEPLFWVQAFLGAAICALGLILDQTPIIIGAALIVPLVRPVVATGLALASGDIYLLVRLLGKLCVAGLMIVLVSAAVVALLPFSPITAEIAARTRPTLLDFLVALFGGMSGAALISPRGRVFHYLPGAVIGITLLPALCVMGFGLRDGPGGLVLRGSGLLFTANMFAAVLGASVVLTLVGIQKVAQAESVRQWKEEELAKPLAQAVLRGLRLQHVIGRTGSARARAVVVGVFLLLVLIPLQSALNQLGREFRTRQAISRAQAVFDIRGRSAVLSTSFVARPDGVAVRIQAATNELFGAADIARFEERVRDQLGLPAHLDLVQTLSDVGQADRIRTLLLARRQADTPPPRELTVAASLDETTALVERVMRDLPLPETLRFVRARGAIGGGGAPTLQLVYLSAAEAGADARSMLVRLVAERTGLSRERITLRWLPATLRVNLSRSGGIGQDDALALKAHGAALAEFPDLRVTVELSSGLSANAAEAARREIVRQLGVPENRVTSRAAAADRRVATITTATPESGTPGSAALVPSRE